MPNDVESLYSSFIVPYGFESGIDFASFADEERRIQALQGEISDYYAEIISQAQGDYDTAVEILTNDYQKYFGTDNKKLLSKLNDAAKVLDARSGRVGADAALAKSDLTEDRNFLKEQINRSRTELSEDFASSVAELGRQERELGRESELQREGLSFDQGQRGVFSGGVVDRERQGLDDRINDLSERLQARRLEVQRQFERGQQGLTDRERLGNMQFGRGMRNIGINERRQREDAMERFNQQKTGLDKKFNAPFTGVFDQLGFQKAGDLGKAGQLVSGQFGQDEYDKGLDDLRKKLKY